MNARMTELKTHAKNRIDDLKPGTTNLKANINNRFPEINPQFESFGNVMHQRFDQLSRELADNRERMASWRARLSASWPVGTTATLPDEQVRGDSLFIGEAMQQLDAAVVVATAHACRGQRRLTRSFRTCRSAPLSARN